ncbi:MAG: ATP-binding protein [Lachnospiraceae bacterium]|nr:ATP-binding protein [Lachnospiraceae bacterium]MCM1302952.1 ATP-binding protein [Butyrivibrio sp.]MCM1343024.1 ATP-binding protein [Muribaculaceae bacterium]MCM1215605.1 ATP-binding protein [Lachnospiraceae bacterium]MCM1238524.1 ATP-binding protein [Lachnospiraceae bacterium]
MANVFYLLNMRIAGIKNIKEEVRLDFYKKTVDKDFDSDRYRIKAVYGENGSGKSAIITAVKIAQDLILNDNYLNESQNQDFLDEMINKSTKTFQFSMEFLVDVNESKDIYDYSVYIGKNDKGLYEIQYEMLKMKNGNYVNNHYKTIFESQNGELSYLACSDGEKQFLERKSANLLSAHSLIYIYIMNLRKDALLADAEVIDRELCVHIIACFTLTLLIKVFLEEEDQHELYFLRKRLKESRLNDQALQEWVFEYGEITAMYLSVSDRIIDKEYFEDYKDKVNRLTQFLKIFKPDLVSIDIDRKENGEKYECDLNLNYGSYSINREFESTGIKKLIRLFDCFVAASTVGIVFVDEMDSNLNDVYLCKLIEYFMYYGKGQLCFTTHNLDPMNILRENRNSIDFLSSDNHLVSWTSRGNASPENCYKNGMIKDSPFNVDATDFVGILGE